MNANTPLKRFALVITFFASASVAAQSDSVATDWPSTSQILQGLWRGQDQKAACKWQVRVQAVHSIYDDSAIADVAFRLMRNERYQAYVRKDDPTKPISVLIADDDKSAGDALLVIVARTNATC